MRSRRTRSAGRPRHKNQMRLCGIPRPSPSLSRRGPRPRGALACPVRPSMVTPDPMLFFDRHPRTCSGGPGAANTGLKKVPWIAGTSPAMTQGVYGAHSQGRDRGPAGQFFDCHPGTRCFFRLSSGDSMLFATVIPDLIRDPGAANTGLKKVHWIAGTSPAMTQGVYGAPPKATTAARPVSFSTVIRGLNAFCDCHPGLDAFSNCHPRTCSGGPGAANTGLKKVPWIAGTSPAMTQGVYGAHSQGHKRGPAGQAALAEAVSGKATKK